MTQQSETKKNLELKEQTKIESQEIKNEESIKKKKQPLQTLNTARSTTKTETKKASSFILYGASTGIKK